MTEICSEDSPHFITHVQTTLSTVTDEALVEPIHQALSEKSLLPEEHLMDLGYVTAGHLVSSQENYGVELIGPVRNDPTWQAKHHPKFANSNFKIDWSKQVAICPRGHQSKTWTKKTEFDVRDKNSQVTKQKLKDDGKRKVKPIESVKTTKSSAKTKKVKLAKSLI